MRRWFVLALCLGCRVAATPTATPVGLDPDELVMSDELAAAEFDRWSLERDEHLREAIDRGELAEHVHRIQLHDLEAGGVAVVDVFQQGEAIFERLFTIAEGRDVNLARVQRGDRGPDALACTDCHGRGGDDGHGELHQRAWLFGDGSSLVSAAPRLAPQLAGLGLVQLLAAEMTSDLQAQAAGAASLRADGAAVTLDLHSKGVSFGQLTVRSDGSLDTSKLSGVAPDLVVRPFGWKGTRATLREFSRIALPQHLGLEPLPQPGDPLARAALPGPDTSDAARIDLHSELFDADSDGVAGEIREGQLTALAVYLALLDVPILRPPRRPEARAAWSRGAAQFTAIGCAECHRPELPLARTTWSEGPPGRPGYSIDVLKDSQTAPTLRRFTAGDLDVPLFSDLRRHDLGPELAERQDGGAGPREFLTRPLWGLGDRGPYYLHDGRARTLRAAILAHGGEASPARDAYAALPEPETRALAVFLHSLRRHPQGRIAP